MDVLINKFREFKDKYYVPNLMTMAVFSNLPKEDLQ